MALIYCPEWKKSVSNTDAACPNRGQSLTAEVIAKAKRKSEKTKKIIGVAFIFLIFSICLPGITANKQPNQSDHPNKNIPTASEVNSLSIRRETIKTGDTSDQVFKILKNSDMVSQNISKDPKISDSFLIVENYEVNGQKFTIHFSRIKDPGPYKVIKIIKG